MLIATGIWWLVLIAFFMGIQGSPPAGPKLFRILDDPDLSSGERLKSTFTNWLGLLSIAVALVWVATSPFPP